jgi:glycerol kinase
VRGLIVRAVLALDQGGHASRGCLVGEHGVIIATREVPIRTIRGSAGEVEHNADEIVESLRTAAAGVLADATTSNATTSNATAPGAAATLQIDSAALATQRSTIVCFERHSGRALSPAISWQDRRNAAWLDSFAAHAERIRALTGLPLSPHYGVGKMRWCLDHLPAVQLARERGDLVIAPLASFLAMRLTQCSSPQFGPPQSSPPRCTALADPANASRTLLWDADQCDWSAELLHLFGIERAWLPPCAPTRGPYGVLQLDAAPAIAPRAIAPRATALLPTALSAIALRAVTGDQSAIPFAFGAPDPGTVYINLGTGAFIQRPLRVRPHSVAPLLASVLLADAGSALYSIEGTVNGAGSAIAQFVADCGTPEPLLWQQLEQLPFNAPLPLYINGIGGLGSPYWRPQQQSWFIGDGSLLERFAAVVESIAFLIAINFDLMRMRDSAPTRVIVSGGLSRSDWLCRRLAALLSVPVLRGAQEATVLGVAALAEPGLFGDSATVAVRPAMPAQFEPGTLKAAEFAALSTRRECFELALSA